MNTRRLSLALILGGAAITLVALIWFMAAFAEAMDMASEFAGDDHAAGMITCLYASSPMCQGAAMFSDAPAYSPAVFWIGVIALLAGIVTWVASGKSAAAGTVARGGTAPAPPTGEVLSFIPPAQYARYSYILALSGSVAGLILMPLAIVALAGFVLALLGLTLYRPRLNALDAHHLALLCLVFAAAALLLFLTRGTLLFLLTALAQIVFFYVGFNSWRHGRTVTPQNVKNEFLLALKPGKPPVSRPEQP